MSATLIDHLTADQVTRRLHETRDAEYLTILLTDGTLHTVPRSSCDQDANDLLIRGVTPEEGLLVALPPERIAQLTKNDLTVSENGDIRRSLDQEMFLDFLASVQAEASDLRTEFDAEPPAKRTITITGIEAKLAYVPAAPPRVGVIQGGRDLLLYTDVRWFEMAHREGKSVSFGLSLFGFGGDVGSSWSKSLLDDIKNIVLKGKFKATSLEGLCSQASDEVRLGDYVHLWPLECELRHGQPDYLMTGVEGRAWRPAFVTRSAHPPGPDNVVPHVVAYFHTGGFNVTFHGWQMLEYPCRIFGHLIPQGIETEFGDQSCHIRVRAAAILAHDQEDRFRAS